MSYPEVITFTAPVAIDRLKARILRQFSEAPVFQAVLQALSVEIQTVLDQAALVQSARTLATATAAQLDVIGRIVGQSRIIPYYTQNPVDWFTPDTTGNNLDENVMYTDNGLDGNDYTMNDAEYRQMIIAKIYRNHCRYGSAEEIMNYSKLALGIPCSAVPASSINVWCSTDTEGSDFDSKPIFVIDDIDNDNTEYVGNIVVYVPIGTPLWKVLWIKRFVTDVRGEWIPIMPFPAGTKVLDVSYI